MKILQAGNTANIGYYTTKHLRKFGIDCDILFERTENYDDPINVESSLHNQYPSWCVTFSKKTDSWKLKILKTIWDKKYELIHAYGQYPKFTILSKKPLIIQALGTEFRNLNESNSIRGKLLLHAYQKARVLLFSMPDHIPIYKKLGLKTGIFFPLLVDSDYYHPLKVERTEPDDKLLILHPTNLNWKFKGNNLLISGFANFVKKNPNSLLMIIERGVDSNKTRELVDSLGITKNVRYIKGPLFGPELLRYYNMADVVTDAFILPAISGTTNESFCCEKPVICYYPRDIFEEIYKEHPPIMNATNSIQVQEQLEALMDPKKRKEIGKKGREWILKYNNPEFYSMKLKIIYESVLNEDNIDKTKDKLGKIMPLKEMDPSLWKGLN